MAEADEDRRSRNYFYRRALFAWRQWWQVVRGEAPGTILTAIAAALIGGWQGSVAGGVLGGLVGAVAGPLVAACLLLVWKWLSAPASLWREQEAELQRLRREISARSIVQVKNFGATARHHPYLNVSDRIKWLNVLSVRYHYDLVNDSDRDAWAYYPKVQILREEGSQWLPVALELKDDTGRMVPKGARLHGLATVEPARYSVLARDGATGEFITYAINFGDFGRQPLRLRLTIDVGGQPSIIAETSLAVVDS